MAIFGPPGVVGGGDESPVGSEVGRSVFLCRVLCSSFTEVSPRDAMTSTTASCACPPAVDDRRRMRRGGCVLDHDNGFCLHLPIFIYERMRTQKHNQLFLDSEGTTGSYVRGKLFKLFLLFRLFGFAPFFQWLLDSTFLSVTLGCNLLLKRCVV